MVSEEGLRHFIENVVFESLYRPSSACSNSNCELPASMYEIEIDLRGGQQPNVSNCRLGKAVL